MSAGYSNVTEKTLAFADGAEYTGQVLGSVPHGYGVMTDKEGFEMAGYFINGKHQGPGRFSAPNGEVFYGTWNANHKRDGRFYSIKVAAASSGASAGAGADAAADSSASASNKIHYIETYKDGELIKRVRAVVPSASNTHWNPSPPQEFASTHPYPFPRASANVMEANRALVAAALAGERDTAPCPRSGHTFSLIPKMMAFPDDAKVHHEEPIAFLFGGQTSAPDDKLRPQLLDDAWILNVETMMWYPVASASESVRPPALVEHTATVVDNLIYIIGGQTEFGVNSCVYVFDILTGEWSCPVNKANGIPVSNHTATFVPELNKIFVILHSQVFSLCLDTHVWTTHEPKDMQATASEPGTSVAAFKQKIRALRLATSSHAAVAIGTKIYVHGGQLLQGAAGTSAAESSGESKTFVRCTHELRVYDIATNSWSILETLPPKCLLNPDDPTHVAAYVTASEHADPKSSPAELYAEALQTAQKMQSADSRIYAGLVVGGHDCPRARHSMSIYTDPSTGASRLVIVGGWTSTNPLTNAIDTSYLADVQILDLATMQWTTPSIRYPLFIPRADFGAILLPPRRGAREAGAWGRLLAVGGINAGSGVTGLWDLSELNLAQDARESLLVTAVKAFKANHEESERASTIAAAASTGAISTQMAQAAGRSAALAKLFAKHAEAKLSDGKPADSTQQAATPEVSQAGATTGQQWQALPPTPPNATAKERAALLMARRAAGALNTEPEPTGRRSTWGSAGAVAEPLIQQSNGDDDDE